MHAEKQDGEAEYIWLDWLKYGWNQGEQGFISISVYIHKFFIKEKQTTKSKQTSPPPPPTQYICAFGTVQQVWE